MPSTYFKTDKNGTKYYRDSTCRKCSGKGYIQCYGHISGGVCFRCGGSGIDPKPQVIKEYTPEYAAKLQARREKRQAKKKAELIAKAGERNAEILEKNGFTPNGVTYVVLGNTFQIKGKLMDAGAKFNRCLGWHMPEPLPELDTLKLAKEEYFYTNEVGTLCPLSYDSEVAYEALVDRIKKANYALQPETHFFGEVGTRYTLKLKLVKTNSFVSSYYPHNDVYIYIFEDENQNKFVWKTGVVLDDSEDFGILVGTVKEHNEYKGTKQTVLTRCNIKTDNWAIA